MQKSYGPIINSRKNHKELINTRNIKQNSKQINMTWSLQ